MGSPTQRTKSELERLGYVTAIVERWNPFAKCRQDLFGFADLIAFHPDRDETLLVQTTTSGHISDRVAKIIGAVPAKPEKPAQAIERVARAGRARRWVAQPHRFIEVWGWGKRGPRGKRKLWTLSRVLVRLDSFTAVNHVREILEPL